MRVEGWKGVVILAMLGMVCRGRTADLVIRVPGISTLQEDAFEVKDSPSPTGSNETQAVKKVCVTDSGATPNKSCIFPFKFNGVLYNECTWTSAHFTDLKPWCSTFVDETGERPIF